MLGPWRSAAANISLVCMCVGQWGHAAFSLPSALCKLITLMTIPHLAAPQPCPTGQSRPTPAEACVSEVQPQLDDSAGKIQQAIACCVHAAAAEQQPGTNMRPL
jgi:hypothetical protein